MDHTNYINKVKKASGHRDEFIKKILVPSGRITIFIFVLFVSGLALAGMAALYDWNIVLKHALFSLFFLYLCNEVNIQWREYRKQKLLKEFAESFPEEAEILKRNKKEQEPVKE